MLVFYLFYHIICYVNITGPRREFVPHPRHDIVAIANPRVRLLDAIVLNKHVALVATDDVSAIRLDRVPHKRQ